jgi:hypothetical protein
MAKRLGLAAAVAIVAGFCAVEAQAMPFSASPLAGVSDLTKVAEGCGPGAFRGRFGQCRPMGGGMGMGMGRGMGYVRPFRRVERCVVRRGPYGGVRRVCRSGF